MELIGRLDRRITIQEPDGLFNADTGEPSGDWSDVISVWSEKLSQKGRDRLLGDQTVSIGKEVFKIRYRTNVSEKMRVVFKSEYYEIESIHEVGRNEILVLVCQRLK